MSRKTRLAYLVSHPIQYQAPLLRRISQEPGIDLTVFFCSDLSVNAYLDKEFGTTFQWDVPLLDGYRHVFLPAIGGTRQLTYWRPFSYGLASYLKQGGFDAMWVHGWGYWSHLWAMFTARRLGLKVMLRGESTLHLPSHGTFKQAMKNAFIRRLVTSADAVLAIGALNRKFYLHYGADPHRVFDMPYAVDNAFFQAACAKAANRREALRATLGLEPGRPIILFASKMTERKRASDLLEAYIRLAGEKRHEPRPYLLFVGDGEMKSELEHRLAELDWKSVRFLGFKNQTELPAFYDLCDVFILPSFNEPWGLVVNEVMNAGRAVIVSDQVGSGPDLVQHGENGYVFRAGDVEDLRTGLAMVLDDPERCAAMGRKSLEIIGRWGFEEDVAGLKRALGLGEGA